VDTGLKVNQGSVSDKDSTMREGWVYGGGANCRDPKRQRQSRVRAFRLRERGL